MTEDKDDFIRTGFQSAKASDRIREQLANAAWNLRRLKKDKRPKISDILIHTRMSQYYGNYFSRTGAACALGVLCLKSDAMTPDSYSKTPDWDDFHNYFNCTHEELGRTVNCPVRGCWHSNCIISMIPHMNDVHRRTNTEIGYWLQQYNL